jgi:hypothetical protein
MQKHKKVERDRWIGAARAIILAAAASLAGCAAPGPPLPPTLNLPAIVPVARLSALRVGDEVRLHWTTPKQTSDKLPIRGAITAEICRNAVSGIASKAACVPVERIAVTPGETDEVDTLPGVLAEGPVRLLAYRVQLLNAAGRTAGPSAAVYVAAGAAPAGVANFAGETTNAGVELRWQQQAATGTVELDRTLLDPATAPAAERKGSLPGEQKEPAEMKMLAGEAGSEDAGGTIDRTVKIGHSYRYTAQRVVSVNVGGQTLAVRSMPTAALSFAVRDVFPPAVPEGLVAVPGFAGQRAAIDLSWEPVIDQDVMPKVAGYKVYRSDVANAAWKLLGTVRVAAYRDTDVVAGQRYAYRVTALSTAGNESTPGGEASETAPLGQP